MKYFGHRLLAATFSTLIAGFWKTPPSILRLWQIFTNFLTLQVQQVNYYFSRRFFLNYFKSVVSTLLNFSNVFVKKRKIISSTFLYGFLIKMNTEWGRFQAIHKKIKVFFSVALVIYNLHYLGKQHFFSKLK